MFWFPVCAAHITPYKFNVRVKLKPRNIFQTVNSKHTETQFEK